MESLPKPPARTPSNTDQGQIQGSLPGPPPRPPQQAQPPASLPPGHLPHGSLPQNGDYRVQETVPLDNYRREVVSVHLKARVNLSTALPQTYPEKFSGEPYRTDHLAYGSEPRDRKNKLSKKERGDPTYDRVAVDVGRIVGNKFKKMLKVEERDDSRADMSSKQRHHRNEEERLRENRNYYKDKFEALELKHREENRRLRAELNQERDRVERAVRSADHMQSTMDNREYFLGEQASDDEVCTMFITLLNEIKNWSQAFSSGSSRTLQEERFQEYQRVTPMYSEFHDLENSTVNKKQKRFFVRGWTGYVMCTKLFRNLEGPEGGLGEDAWLEKAIAGNFRFLENRLLEADRREVPYKSFSDWRAFTAELLGKAVRIQNGRPVSQASNVVGQAVSEVMEVIRPWHKEGTPETMKVDEDKLYTIFASAVQLAQVLRRQRALWSVRLPWAPGGDGTTPLFTFDPTCMEDERNNDEFGMEELKTRCVEFIVTPALYKRGTMNGERFDKEDARCRAAVVIVGLN
ncbi:hypothetical protein IQ07DRAFT_681058 [Pyrenochaeta sp. DS3sAY3a]|nr:hypothetical protein IQ07DRAFT_681058 [Pyrenochaeta sp. DS3sAY3a]